jgi:hypothetical protein
LPLRPAPPLARAPARRFRLSARRGPEHPPAHEICRQRQFRRQALARLPPSSGVGATRSPAPWDGRAFGTIFGSGGTLPIRRCRGSITTFSSGLASERFQRRPDHHELCALPDPVARVAQGGSQRPGRGARIFHCFPHVEPLARDPIGRRTPFPSRTRRLSFCPSIIARACA